MVGWCCLFLVGWMVDARNFWSDRRRAGHDAAARPKAALGEYFADEQCYSFKTSLSGPGCEYAVLRGYLSKICCTASLCSGSPYLSPFSGQRSVLLNSAPKPCLSELQQNS